MNLGGVQVDVMEIEQAMVEGARYFFAVNHGVHDRDNVRIHETDAVLATTIRGVDVLLIGFTDGARIDRERLRQGMAVEAIAADLARSPVGIQTPDDLLAHLRLGPDALRELAGRGPLNTDDRPILSYSAPRSRYLDTNRKNEALITRYADGVEPLLFDSGQPEAD